MRLAEEVLVELGFRRSPAAVCDEIEQTSAAMIRNGWSLVDAVMEDGLGFIHLFFERETEDDSKSSDLH